eukprot:GEMP01110639.1.p1 GENE.GEMP01110639.1~~GEMP01110639.1.p1  ORF type:complete len:123 (-),score=3.39 GEMP01110639.1:329-661(-)
MRRGANSKNIHKNRACLPPLPIGAKKRGVSCDFFTCILDRCPKTTKMGRRALRAWLLRKTHTHTHTQNHRAIIEINHILDKKRGALKKRKVYIARDRGGASTKRRKQKSC